MLTWLSTAIIAALCIASAAVWGARLFPRRVPPEGLSGLAHDAGTETGDVGAPPPVVAPAGVVSPGAILFAGLWIVYDLVGELTGTPVAQNFDPDRTLRVLQQNCGLLGAGAGVIWMLLTRGEPAQFRSFGVDDRRLAAQVRNALVTVTAAWLPVFVVLLATLPLRTSQRQHSVFQLLDEWPSLEIYAWAVLAAVVLAPIFEELVFRVILQTWLARRIGRAAVPTAALLFAAVHRFPDSLAIIPLALVLGDAYDRRRSYWEVVTAHALFNAVMLALYATMSSR
jgi:membrane protease YdiL (CAAX protease family)